MSLLDSKFRYCNSPKLYRAVSGSIVGPMLLLSNASHKSLCSGFIISDGKAVYPEYNAKLISRFSNVELTSLKASGDK